MTSSNPLTVIVDGYTYDLMDIGVGDRVRVSGGRLGTVVSRKDFATIAALTRQTPGFKAWQEACTELVKAQADQDAAGPAVWTEPPLFIMGADACLVRLDTGAYEWASEGSVASEGGVELGVGDDSAGVSA